MKLISFWLPICLFILCTSTSLAQWQAIDPGPASENYLLDLYAVDERKFFACDFDGRILQTHDGGNTWSSIRVDQEVGAIYNDITFADAQHGFAVGRILFGHFIIDRTADGGQTWSRQLFGPFSNVIFHDGFVEIDFPTAAVGYVAGDYGRLYRTTDAGASWQNYSPPTNNTLVAMDFVDQNKGYVLADYSNASDTEAILFKTTNAGESWQRFDAPILGRLQFLSAEEGFLHNGIELYYTADGGATWDEISNLPSFIADCWFVDSMHGYLIDGETVYQTLDGGETWLIQGQQIGERMRRLHFLSPENGWIVGGGSNQAGEIFKTDNGGGMAGKILVGPVSCPGDMIHLNVLHTGAQTFQWMLGDQLISQSEAASFVPDSNGNYLIHLRLNDSNLELSLNAEVEVRSMDLSNYLLATTHDSVCLGERVTFEFPALTTNTVLNIQVGDDVVAAQLRPYPNAISWESPPIDSITHFDIYIEDIYCGTRLWLSKKIYAAAAPSSDPLVELLQTPLCEGEEGLFRIPDAESHIYYQLIDGDGKLHASQWTNGGDIQLISDSLEMDAQFHIKALASEHCYQFLDTILEVEIMNVEPTFALSTQNVLLGQEVKLHNTSADSLSFEWQLDDNIELISSDSNRCHLLNFTHPGTSFVQLRAISPKGCVDTYQRQFIVHDTVGLFDDWVLPQPLGALSSPITDQEGNIYVSTTSLSTPLLINSIKGEGFSWNGGQIALICKFNKNGILQWHNQLFLPEFVSGIGFASPDLSVNATGELIALFTVSANPGTAILTSTDGNHFKPRTGRSVLLVKYSSTGVLEWVEEITCTGSGLVNHTSLETDQDGKIFMLGRKSCRDLQFKTTHGFINHYQSDSSAFIARFLPGGQLEWIRPYAGNYRSPDHHTYGFQPVSIKPDRSGGVYIWSRGGPNNWIDNSYAVNLAHFDSEGRFDWDIVGEMWEEDETKFIYANAMEVDDAGNVIVGGTFRGSSFFGRQFPGQAGVFISKVGKDGNRHWTRSMSDQIAIPSGHHNLLGLDTDGDLIYTLVRHCTSFEPLDVEPVCDNPAASYDNLYLIVWDSLGNLLEVTSTDIGTCAPISQGSVIESLTVQDGGLHISGGLRNVDNEDLFGYPIPTNYSGSAYLARIPDPKSYYPYITLPESSNLTQCKYSACENDLNRKVMVSYYFSNIQWEVDGETVDGENKPSIMPFTSGSYAVKAKDHRGEIVYSPSPTEIEVLEVPEMEVSQIGRSLRTDLYEEAYYRWRDARLRFLEGGRELNAYTPAESGYYLVDISLSNGCRVRTALTYFNKNIPISSQESPVHEVQVFPNPTNGRINLTIDLERESLISLLLVNNVGQKQMIFEHKLLPEGRNQLNLDLQQLRIGKGLYQLMVMQLDQECVRSIVILH